MTKWEGLKSMNYIATKFQIVYKFNDKSPFRINLFPKSKNRD